jgi:hypothetical protein
MEELQKTEPTGLKTLSNATDLFAVGQQLKEFIKKNSLSTDIAGKQYAHVDAWKFAGSCFGLTAIAFKPEKKHIEGDMMRIAFSNITVQGKNGNYQKEVIIYYGYIKDSDGYRIATTGKNVTREIVKPYYAYECECDIIRMATNEIVSHGTGFCSNLEASKALFDEYSVNSMSQTRSIGKAYRNVIGYIMNEAGYQSTPAEEMDESHIRESAGKEQKPTKPTLGQSQVNAIIQRIRKGELKDLTEVEKFYSVTQEQKDTFQLIYDSLKA